MARSHKTQAQRLHTEMPTASPKFMPVPPVQAKRSKQKADVPEVNLDPLNYQLNLANPLASMYGHDNLAATLPVQPKLTVGAVGDKHEQEADQVAAQVVNAMHSPAAAQSAQRETVQREEMEEEELQMKPLVQREEMEEEELQMKPLVQRVGAEGGAVSDDFEQQLQSAKGSGQALDAGLQSQMGQAMGADFSGVKVHTDSQSDQLNQSIQAKAFTTGQDVFFSQGAYNPSSKDGQELIAHELTHVVQQNGGSTDSANRSLIQAARGRSGAITEEDAPDLDDIVDVAKLNIHVDLDATDAKINHQVKGGSVGHAWVSLEWNDPTNVPTTFPELHQRFLRAGNDPFGFWPNMTEWEDFSGMTDDELLNNIGTHYNGTFNAIYEHMIDQGATHDEAINEIVQLGNEILDYEKLWGRYKQPDNPSYYKKNPFDSYVPGRMLHPDKQHKAKATQTFDLTKREAEAVINYAESKKGAQYSVFYYNCTTFAKEAAQAAGKTPPKSTTAGIAYPAKLYKSIQDNYTKDVGKTAMQVRDDFVKRNDHGNRTEENQPDPFFLEPQLSDVTGKKARGGDKK
jgi:hypothetical protein